MKKPLKLAPCWEERPKRKEEFDKELRAKGISEQFIKDMWLLSNQYTGARAKDQYYREIARMWARRYWRDEPNLSIFDMARQISLWLEELYEATYDYKQSVYRWIKELAPYEPRQTRKPRK